MFSFFIFSFFVNIPLSTFSIARLSGFLIFLVGEGRGGLEGCVGLGLCGFLGFVLSCVLFLVFVSCVCLGVGRGRPGGWVFGWGFSLFLCFLRGGGWIFWIFWIFSIFVYFHPHPTFSNTIANPHLPTPTPSPTPFALPAPPTSYNPTQPPTFHKNLIPLASSSHLLSSCHIAYRYI